MSNVILGEHPVGILRLSNNFWLLGLICGSIVLEVIRDLLEYLLWLLDMLKFFFNLKGSDVVG